MRRAFFSTVSLLVFLSAAPLQAGDVPDTMTTQGVLRNTAGDVVNGVYQLTFTLYDAQENGQLLWAETADVSVENGVYTAELGAVTPIGRNLFKNNSEVWLGVSVESEAELPRIPVTTVAYAFHSRSALVADSAADLNCSGCIEESMLAFEPVTQDNLVQSVKDSAVFVESANAVVQGALDVSGAVTAAAFVGDGSGLSGISSPQGSCDDGWFVSSITADGTLICAQAASGLTSVDGLAGGTIDGDLDVTGTIVGSNGLSIDGDGDVSGDLHVGGTISGHNSLAVNGNAQIAGSLKVGQDDGECNADKAGALRYQDSVLQWCDGSLWNTLGKGRAMFRWAQWSTFGQGWYGDNRPELFGGVTPSHWGDGLYSAQNFSANTEVLKTLFWHKGPTIGTVKNAMVMADEWYPNGTTNSRHTAVLFRIRNTSGRSIVWTPYWYKTSYGGWGERAGIALNGASIWNSINSDIDGNDVDDESSHDIILPANRTSTVIFFSSSSPEHGSRSNFLAFYHNSLDLPDGLEYVDDLDNKPDGWDN